MKKNLFTELAKRDTYKGRLSFDFLYARRITIEATEEREGKRENPRSPPERLMKRGKRSRGTKVSRFVKRRRRRFREMNMRINGGEARGDVRRRWEKRGSREGKRNREKERRRGRGESKIKENKRERF